MKVAAALILCAITLARGQEVELNKNGCPIDYTYELLYAHEICNKFYQCTHGELVIHNCAGDLLFNVDKQECDWPHDTDCGDRVIPGPESEENVEESTEDKASQEGEEDNNGENGDDNNGNGDNNATCNCNPGEAPAICAGSDSEGKLIAHENCNQFYKCSDGVPVAVSCYGDLLYNPYTEVCDWPHNVDCGERVIPDCDDNNGDNGSEENNNEDNSSGDNGNGNGDNNTTCNCNPGEAPSICAGSESEGVLIAHENCNQFYKCSQGIPVVMSCYGDLLYNPYTEQCDWPSNVDCGDRLIPDCDEDNGTGDNNNGENGSDGDNGTGGNGDGDDGNGDGTGSCNCNPGEAPSICAGSGSEGVLIAHENCNQFYKCSQGVPVAMSCYGDLLYNPYTEQCDWPSNVECGDRVIPDCDEDNNNNGDNGTGDNNNGENGSNGDNGTGGNGDGDDGNGDGTGSCNCNPGEAPSICAGSGSEGVLIAHENCNQFYKCSQGVPVAMSCYGDLLYNPYTEQCDWPSNVECGDRVIPDCDEDNNNNGDNGTGDNNNGENGSDGDNNTGDNGDGDNGNGDGTGSCNCNPGEAPSICAGSGSEGVLIAHENCNQFYKCSQGVPVAMSCYGDLLYNPYTEQCDWPSNVECGDRVIPDCDEDNNNNGDNGTGDNNNGENGSDGDNNTGDNGNGDGTGSCNCNPGEAPSICAGSGSEGVLIAHENCNQFYMCSHGVPVVMSCNGDLLYNPYTEQCDWPSNVECGNRVIPDCDEDNNNNGDNGTGDNNNGENGSDGDNNNGENGSDGDNNTGDNGDGDNGNGDGTGSCNCNPGEAPSICAGSGSEGVLIAHENCNQFYKCSQGVPVAMSCYGDLLYNPYTEQCDWPSNVECGDRVIPDCDEDNNNNGDNGTGDNNNGENGSDGDNNTGDNGDGDNGNGDGTGSCNCNPGEAPSICAGSGSEGVLIAHENCNQFYKCSQGVPVAMSCYGDLLYNPYTEQCDWPSNVECGDRVIPDCDEDNNNNGDNGTGDNNNGENGSDGDNNTGDNGNGDGTGSCNCNPGEAPSICAGSGSEGVLIAHENCNQFYMCSHGVPVVMSCNGDLLYNPYTEQCDWPSNVECGNRVIPDCDEDNNNNGDNGTGDNNNGENGSDGDNNNGENGSDGDNNTGDNGDGDNGNGDGTGSCNCNPGEAPSICAGSGSEGVLIAHENCNQFYICSHGVPITMSCNGDLLYNPYTEHCDWPNNVECGDRVIPECDDDNNSNGDNASGGSNNGENGSGDNDNGENGSGGDDNNGGNSDGNDSNGNGTGSCNCNPGEAPSICAGSGSEGVLIAHENCNQFYKCSQGVPVAMSCYGDLLYNPYTEQCDWPSNVECGDRVIPDCDEDNNNNGDNGTGDNNNGENGSDGDNNTGDNGNGDGTGSCNCNPGEAPSICAGSGSEGVLIAHENCNQFYMCSHGVPVVMSCNGDLLYNPYTEQCDWPSNVECGDRVIPECDDDNNSNGDNASDGSNNGENGSGDNNNGDNGSGGDNNNGGNGDGDNGNGNGTSSCNCNPGEAPSICAGSGSEGVLIAHENCNQFYICSHGVPITMSCNGDLLYNPYTEHCDWPNNVECGDRVIPECDDDNNSNGDNASGGSNNGENGSGDNDNGENGSGGDDNNGGNSDGNDSNGNGTGSCNCNPGEAPSICAGSGSEGVLIAHENCNQFYKCSHGIPVAMSCYGDLLYNPYTEQCDWPSNVECGDRVIPECEDDNNSNGDNASGGNNNGENGSGDSNNGENGSGGDNNNGGNGDGDDGNGNGTGSCNCNPGEAPSICAGSGSEGVLIAHENCNQFYKCSQGVPVAMSCYGDLLYNPYTEQCDWPSNVECGDRVIPECDEDNNNNGDNGTGDNNNGENGSDGDDSTGGNGDGNNGNGDGTGSCNCNPGEAPSICAGSGSEGVLIAHENCNQFYKCSYGIPVAMSCYGDLLYNPYTEQCDWPSNVECGDRVIPECDDDNNGNGDNTSGENNNGESGSEDNNNGENDGDSNNGGNGNGNGTCNCNPVEAPAICAGSESEGMLIAHENCNQFYKCANGIPVALVCYGDLLYNPYTEQCDWPDKVDCGARVIPVEIEDNKDENENEEDNKDENENKEDNDNVEENCDGIDVPEVCKSEGSDGVFVAHENCNQFYVCSDKQATILDCPGVLLYDVVSHRCEWPVLVDCGDRNIIETEDNGNNNDACNCNPLQAPVLCAHEDSDGELIAHENCDQFYMCSNGIPVTFNCTATLLYNPYKQVCDWPENVDCNGRSLSYFTSMNKHLIGRKLQTSKA